MNALLFFVAWFVVTQVADTIMMLGTTMFVGPQDFGHIGHTIIMIAINVKIYFIMNKHLIKT